MGSSLYSGVSGINACSKQMDVISNNIANSNTIGFKASKVYFADILSQNLTGGAQIGRGVSVSNIGTQFSTGSFETTSSGTDLSIDGDGFFIVKDQNNANYYTRAGAFSIDVDGYLVDLNGYRVQGLTGAVAAAETMGDINLSGAQSKPVATNEFSLGVNLDAETAEDDTYYVSQTIYDSLGGSHTLSIEFTKTATAGEWEYHAYIDDVESDTTVAAAGTITFDGDGILDAAPTDVELNFDDFQANNLATGAGIGDANDMIWVLSGDLATTTTPESITSYASTSSTSNVNQDGYASGVLSSVSIGSSGQIDGYFTNGQTSTLGYIVLANFTNTSGLTQAGSNLFSATIESGEAVTNQAGAGGMGTIVSNALEMSNTEIATEFINIITAQRAYQANAKVVQTTDEMMEELISIKR